MAEADLGKIVGMIMENPELVEKIKAMGEGRTESEEAPTEAEKPMPEAPVSISAPNSKRSRRNELLHALESFLSEDRRKSLETMMTIADVLDTMKAK